MTKEAKTTKKSPAEDLAEMTDTRKPLDGSGNNVERPEWGKAHTSLVRLTAPGDAGALHTVPAARKRIHHWDDHNPRTISNLVCREDADIKDPDGRTHWMWAWGQFLDHQLDLTLETEERVDVEVDPTDPALDGAPNIIGFHRSVPAPGTGIRHDAPREYRNVLSSYIDGSSVYGNTTDRLSQLIEGDGPYLRTSGEGDPGNLANRFLPKNTPDRAADNADPSDFGGPEDFFVAGDVRANEHVVLTSLHTIFVRLHNWKAAQIEDAEKSKPKTSQKSPAEIFHHTRCWVGAVMQAITYCEFVPELLGVDALQGAWEYKGYKSNVESTVSIEFSTAAYRLGHSMLPGSIPVAETVEGEGELTLEQAFFRPSLVEKHNVAAFISGLHSETMQQVDTRITDGVRNFLFRFGPNGADRGLLDLACLNIMRGRDHRIAGYNDVREGLGLPRVQSFGEICGDPITASRLQQAYGDVDSVDLWIGGLAEAALPGAAVGETFHTILHDQFIRLRDGDRYHWLNTDHPVLGADEQADITSWTLARVLNTVVEDLPAFNDDDNLFNTCAKHRLHLDEAGDAGTGAPSYH